MKTVALEALGTRIREKRKACGWTHWQAIHGGYVRSIGLMDLPEGAGSPDLASQDKGPDNQWNRNGVVYLEQRFVENMVNGEHGNAEADCDLGRSCAS